MALKHRKKRNVGLVYEFLLRKMSERMLEGDGDGFAEAVDVARRFFSEGMPLARERELFETVRTARGLDGPAARRVLSEVLEASRSLDAEETERQKSLLIGEVNRRFGRDFFARYRLPEYRLLASIQLALDGARGRRLSEAADRVRLEEALVGYMASSADALPADLQAEGRVDGTVYRLALKKFDDRYGRNLGPRQKKVLGEYVRFLHTGDRRRFLGFLGEQRGLVRAALSQGARLEEVRKDPVMAERLQEAAAKLRSLEPSTEDSAVSEMLLFARLAEELESDE